MSNARLKLLAARLSRTRRAFALPLVVLLLLVGGLTVALLLERHGVSYRAIVRNVDNYKNHHRAAGIKECILRWLDTARGRLDQSLDSEGLAFSMDVSGEGRIDVSLFDAQGSTLSDPTALSGRRREIVEDMKFLIETVPQDQRPNGIFRPVGPPEICLNTAPDLLIKALCLAVIGEPNKANQAAVAIFNRRGTGQSGRLDSSRESAGRESSRDLGRDAASSLSSSKAAGLPAATGAAAAPNANSIADALRDIPITERQRKEIASMLVIQPSLYECVVETRNSSNVLLNKSSGLYHLDDSRSDTFKQGGGFLTWDALPLEDSRIVR